MLGSMPLWDSLAGLQVRIDDYALERRELSTSSVWTRVTTTVVLNGDDGAGEGEDVTYTAPDHDHMPADLMLAGTWTLGDFSSYAWEDLRTIAGTWCGGATAGYCPAGSSSASSPLAPGSAQTGRAA